MCENHCQVYKVETVGDAYIAGQVLMVMFLKGFVQIRPSESSIETSVVPVFEAKKW